MFMNPGAMSRRPQNRVPVAPAGYVGPGDIVASAIAWYGLRAYTNASIGSNCIRISRDFDSAQQDFVTVAGGGVDVAAIASFLGGGTGKIVTWYDQVTGTYSLTNASDPGRPAITLAGIGSLPVVSFSGAVNQRLTAISNMGAKSQPYTVSLIAERTGNFTTQGGMIYFNGNGGDIEAASTTGTWVQYSGSSANFAASNSNPHALQAIYNGASSNVYLDGSSTSTNPGTSSAGGGSGVFAILGDNGGGHAFTGWVGEVGFWASAFSGTDQSNMNSNQRAYWGF